MRLHLVVIAAAALCTGLAHAAPVSFTFTMSSNGVSGSGTISGNVDPYNADAYDITSGSGTFGSQQLSLFTPSGNTQSTKDTGGTFPYTYDNVLFTSGSALDSYGLLFSVVGTASLLNIFYDGTFSLSEGSTDTFNPVNAASFSVAAASIPEPSGMALLGAGVLGMVGLGRKRLVRTASQ